MTRETLDFLLRRRSVKPVAMSAPGPSPSELEQILTAAARVPDHKKMVPWRFVLFEGDARARFGEVIAAACQAEEKEPPSPTRLETELGWKQQESFETGLRKTVQWYLENPEWVAHVTSGDYRHWVQANYRERG